MLGVLLFVIGLRGRRINDHPICARCRFDLIGLANPAACPECGSELGKARAIRTGARRKRPAFMATGAAMLLLTALAATVVQGGSTLDRYMPSWLLVLECRFRAPARVSGMLTELIARSDRNELSNAARATLARQALHAQSTNLPDWSREWASVLSDPTFSALLTPKERDAAAAAGSNVKLQARGIARSGGELPISITHSVSDRFLHAGRMCLTHDVRVVIRDSAGKIVYEWKEEHAQTYGATPGSTIGATWTVQPDIAPGKYKAELSCLLRVPAVGGGGNVELPASATQDVTIVPADQPTVELVHDPEVGALFVKSVAISMHLSKYGNSGQYAGMSVGFHSTGTNDDLRAWTRAKDAKFRYQATLIDSKGKEVPAGTLGLSLIDSGWMLSPGGAVVPDAFEPGRYRLRLSPDIKGGEESIDDLRIVDEAVEMDIDIDRQMPVAPTLPSPKK
jgi:hypothetical protein